MRCWMKLPSLHCAKTTDGAGRTTGPGSRSPMMGKASWSLRECPRRFWNELVCIVAGRLLFAGSQANGYAACATQPHESTECRLCVWHAQPSPGFWAASVSCNECSEPGKILHVHHNHSACKSPIFSTAVRCVNCKCRSWARRSQDWQQSEFALACSSNGTPIGKQTWTNSTT